MLLTFRVIRIGEAFMNNGNLYVKKSTRTAKMVGYDQRTFYFQQSEGCKI